MVYNGSKQNVVAYKHRLVSNYINCHFICLYLYN